MALKSTIYKAALQVADMDRGVYADHALTVALHPSETEERMMVRIVAYALFAPADAGDGALQFGRGLSDTEDPDLLRADLTGRLRHWIDVGAPDDRRLAKAAGRADRVTVCAYAPSVPIWWAALAPKVARLSNLEVWHWPSAQTRELAALAERTMSLQLTVQDGHAWIVDGRSSVELTPSRLFPA